MATGRIQHLCLLTGGTTPAGVATAIEGDYEINRNAIETEGIGDQLLAVPGFTTATVNFKAVGFLKAEMVKFAEPAAGSAMTALGVYLLQTDTGEIYKLENGCGSNLKIEVGADANSMVQVSGTMQFGKVSETTGTPVYLTSGGHQKRHCTVEIDASAATVNTFALDSGLTVEPSANLDAARTAYAAWNCTESKPTLTCEMSTLLEDPTDFLAGDLNGAFVPHDIVIELANGTAGENVTFTLADMIAPVRKGTLQTKGVIYHSYEWARGTGAITGRLTIA